MNYPIDQYSIFECITEADIHLSDPCYWNYDDESIMINGTRKITYLFENELNNGEFSKIRKAANLDFWYPMGIGTEAYAKEWINENNLDTGAVHSVTLNGRIVVINVEGNLILKGQNIIDGKNYKIGLVTGVVLIVD